jgi:8-oxo-(d)GTP phosphatase
VADLVRAAGAVLWRRSPAGVDVALVHRPRYDDWSLPKGKLDPAEPEAVAAVREVVEETGFTGPLGRGLGATAYDVVVDGRLVPKTVRWWSLEAVEGAFTPGEEVDQLRWVDAAAAVDLLGTEAAPLRHFLSAPADTVTVLVVRHAPAGDRSSFHGPDDERPLDDDGRLQSDLLADVLSLWRPVRVLSAPPVRCIATVVPLSSRVGHDVEVVAHWGEDAWDRDAALADLHGLARAGTPAVVCSQGGAIPDLVGHLTSAHGRVRAKKGSTWALSFDTDGRFVDADHTLPL